MRKKQHAKGAKVKASAKQRAPKSEQNPPKVEHDVPDGTSATGRPTKLTSETVRALTDALDAGMSLRQACLIADIGESTFHEWTAKAKAGDEHFAEFLECTTRAKTRGVRARLDRVRRAGIGGEPIVDETVVTEDVLTKDGKVITLTKTTKTTRMTAPDWRADTWWLERVKRKQFGTVPVKHEGEIKHTVSGIDGALAKFYGGGDDAQSSG